MSASEPPSDSVSLRLGEKLAWALSAPLPQFTPRRIKVPVVPHKACAVIGMRRAGKTTWLHQLRQERMEQGVPGERLVYVNFEDEQLVGLEARHLNVLLEGYYRQFPQFRGRETVTFFLDEMQLVPGWEKFVRRVMDAEKVEVFVSGSSAALLSRAIATAMRGRVWEVVVHPFSFAEYLRHHGLPVPARLGFLTPAERSALEKALVDYLTVGGFPEAQGLEPAARFRLLRDYVDVALLRDVMERHKVGNVVALRYLVRQLLGNAGAHFSVEKFYAALKSQGIRTSKDSLHDYLAYLEDCFLVRTVWLDSASERQRMVNPRKAYPVDPGLIPVYDRSGRTNLGHALETAVMIELERRQMDISYVRTPGGLEVDFLARPPGGAPELLRVCVDLSAPGAAEREFRALADAARAYPNATCRLLTLTHDLIPQEWPANIVVQSASQWLLES